MTETATNESFVITRHWRAELERDHTERRDAFRELLDAGCHEETLVGLLINLQCSIGRTKRGRGELTALAKKIDKWGRAIERLRQTDVAGILDLMNVKFQISCENCKRTWEQGRPLNVVLRDAAATLVKQTPQIPAGRNVWESRALTLLEDYVRVKTGGERGELTNAREKALNTLASAVLGKKSVPVRVRAHRFRKAARKEVR